MRNISKREPFPSQRISVHDTDVPWRGDRLDEEILDADAIIAELNAQILASYKIHE
jgi:hypothetical protein